MLEHLKTLNEAQREAVLHTKGPLLVLAGAGAGKTRVIAHRILELVREGEAPEHILAITFTNKAAREMRERIHTLLQEEHMVGKGERLPFVSTFHSLGLTIIKENYRAFGFKRFPIVYDRADSLRAIKQALKELGVGEEVEPRMALSVMSRHKGEGATPEAYLEQGESSRARVIARAWERYEELLHEEQALDFDDLLVRVVSFLRDNPQARQHYQNRWRFVHIDEYQDTNRMQGILSGFLVGPEKNICAVGDIDQTIYTWRGAEIRNIMNFEKEHPGTRVVVLEENYRSTKKILLAANACIAKNQYRVEKNLFTQNKEGAAISLYQAFDENDEARFVARTIDDLLARKHQPRDIAVLYRANFQSRVLEEALLAANIPYQVLGTRFFERKEVKDALSFIRAALYGSAADISRIANVPRRGIGPSTLLAMLSSRENELRPDARNKVSDFRALLQKIAEQAAQLGPSELIQFVVKQSGMEREFKEEGAGGIERLENLGELGALASRYDALPKEEALSTFLEDAALQSDQDEFKEERDAVRLMTVHASKGLEFCVVFITGLEEGLFPYAREEEDETDKEEERRLMYVALTRAQEKLYLCFASMRTMFGLQSFSEPSQFLGDIPENIIEWETPERLGKTIFLD